MIKIIKAKKSDKKPINEYYPHILSPEDIKKIESDENLEIQEAVLKFIKENAEQIKKMLG